MVALAHWWTTPNKISNWRTFLALMERMGQWTSSEPLEEKIWILTLGVSIIGDTDSSMDPANHL
jgi:hypothetical protein